MTCCAISLFPIYEKPKTTQFLFRKRIFPGVFEIGVIFGSKCIDFFGVLKGSDCLSDRIICIDRILADTVAIGLTKERSVVGTADLFNDRLLISHVMFYRIHERALCLFGSGIAKEPSCSSAIPEIPSDEIALLPIIVKDRALCCVSSARRFSVA
jgi:hypothetical protein